MIAFGGAGPVHAYGLAKLLKIKRIISPFGAGVTSALGFLVAAPAIDYVRSYVARLDAVDWAHLNALYAEMETEARNLLVESGATASDITIKRQADMRYVGQGFEIQVPVPAGELGPQMLDQMRELFLDTYQSAVRPPRHRRIHRGPDLARRRDRPGSQRAAQLPKPRHRNPRPAERSPRGPFRRQRLRDLRRLRPLRPARRRHPHRTCRRGRARVDDRHRSRLQGCHRRVSQPDHRHRKLSEKGLLFEKRSKNSSLQRTRVFGSFIQKERLFCLYVDAKTPTTWRQNAQHITLAQRHTIGRRRKPLPIQPEPAARRIPTTRQPPRRTRLTLG